MLREVPVHALKAIIIAAASVVLMPATAASSRDLVIGVTDNAATLHDLALVRAHADGQAALGATLVRTGVNWNAVEPRRGRWDWRFYDAVYESLARRGLQVLPVLLVTPGWQAPRLGDMPTNPAAYARYVGRVVARYGPGGEFWRARPQLDGRLASQWFDIWNEPYLWLYSTNGVDPAKYARLLKAAVRAGRSAAPGARFLVEAELSWQVGRTAAFTGSWIDAMYDAVPDLNAWFDGVSVHPYSGSTSPARCSSAAVARRLQFCRVRDIHLRFAAHGASDKPLWITEIGWATCVGAGKCVSAQRQAEFLATMFQLAALYPPVQAVLPYGYQDLDARIPGDYYGLYDGRGKAKPALDSLRYAVRVYGRRSRLDVACDLVGPLGPIEAVVAQPCAR
jgi:hypothetical protein